MISFVVIAYNEEHQITSCLQSIADQLSLEEYEVIVVDDGSTDATSELVRRAQTSNRAIHLVEQPNKGRGAARAAGVALAKGDCIAMVDGDISLPSHWLETCRDALEHCDAVGGTAVPDGDVAFLYNTFRLTPLGTPATTTVTGNNGLYRREVFDKVAFDDRLREGEDVDLNHQLEAQGYRLARLENLQVEHHEDKSFVESVSWLWESGRGASRQLFRFREVRVPDAAFFGAVAVATVAWLGRRRHRFAAGLLVPAYLLLTSRRHLAGRFARRGAPGYRARYEAAVLVDAVFVAAYFAGRLLGVGDWALSVLRRDRTATPIVARRCR